MIKISLVMFAALVVTALLRTRSAALRHWVLAAAIWCAMAMPALEFAVPSWRVRRSAVTRPHRRPHHRRVPRRAHPGASRRRPQTCCGPRGLQARL